NRSSWPSKSPPTAPRAELQQCSDVDKLDAVAPSNAIGMPCSARQRASSTTSAAPSLRGFPRKTSRRNEIEEPLKTPAIHGRSKFLHHFFGADPGGLLRCAQRKEVLMNAVPIPSQRQRWRLA